MRRLTLVVLAGALVLTLGGPQIWAGELEGVTLPDEVTIGDATLVLNGMGLRKKLWVEVYVGGLYLESKSSDPGAIVNSDQAKKVVMHFLTDRATKKKMDAAWVEGFEANSPNSRAMLRRRIDTFTGYFGDMKVGDVIEMVIVPGKGTTVSFNGEEKGVINGDDFAKALLLVWLGDAPPTEDLKNGMLGISE